MPEVGNWVMLAMVGWEVREVSPEEVLLVHTQHQLWPDRFPRVALRIARPAFEAYQGRKVDQRACSEPCPRCGGASWSGLYRVCLACGLDRLGEEIFAKARPEGPIGDVVGIAFLRLLPRDALAAAGNR